MYSTSSLLHPTSFVIYFQEKEEGHNSKDVRLNQVCTCRMSRAMQAQSGNMKLVRRVDCALLSHAFQVDFSDPHVL